MFGKKERRPPSQLPPVADTRQIKQNIGNVSNSGMVDIGVSMDPPPPPPPPTQTAPMPPALPQRSPYAPPIEQEQPQRMLPSAAMELPAIAPKPGAHGKKPSPPLFIKIDKYRELVQNIKELRSNALNLRDTLDALNDIEKELKNGISITQNSLDRFNTILTTLDSKLLRVGAEEDIVQVPRDMDNYVKNMYDHVERIKHDLKTIKEQ